MISHIFLSGFILLYLTTTTAFKAAPRFSSQTVMSDKQSQHVPKNDVLQPYNNGRRHLRGQQQQQVQKRAKQQVLSMSVCKNTALTSALQIQIGGDLPTLHEVVSMMMIWTHFVPGAGVPAEFPPRWWLQKRGSGGAK